MFKQYIAPNQLQDTSYTLCWAASWHGEDHIYFDSIKQSGKKSMLKAVHKMLDEADVVVHYNGTKFDIPTLQRDFLLHGLSPPAPFKQVDLLKTVRSQFRFAFNKMDFVAKQLGLEGKTSHSGHQLWLDCMAGKQEAWDQMEEYNIQDVIVLEGLYEKLKGWIKIHPNHSVYEEAKVCPNCGSEHFQKRGIYVSGAGKYQRYQCKNTTCNKWFRDTKMQRVPDKFVPAN